MLNDYWTKTLPLHPKLVHVPIALCILMPLVATMIWLGVRRGWFSPAFGIKTPAPRLVFRGEVRAGEPCRFILTLLP